jgi:hypothetical protein
VPDPALHLEANYLKIRAWGKGGTEMGDGFVYGGYFGPAGTAYGNL